MCRWTALALALGTASVIHASAPEAHRLPELPLRFEPGPGGGFVAIGPGFNARIEPGGNTLSLLNAPSPFALRMRFPNARPDARLEATGPLSSRTNYFIGNTPARWRIGVPNYSRVRVAGLFPGIDLEYYGPAGRLECDFIVHPGSTPDAIVFEADGAHRMRINSAGDLVLSRGGSQIHWNAPLLYQVVNGKRVEVAGGFVLAGPHHVRFRIGRYDRNRNLVIDPTLAYVSYLGGSGKDFSRGAGTDSAGNVYVTGGTTSPNLAVTPGAEQSQRSGPPDAFVAKFSPSGSLLYMTYLGGSQIDYATALTVDSAGNAYVTGMTNSFDFPVSSTAWQKSYAGSAGNNCQKGGDAFVFKLNPTGSQLLYATYLGGHRDDIGTSIAIDPAGDAYVAGSTISTDFPTTSGAYQTTLRGFGGQTGKPICNDQPWFNSGDAFVTKLNPTASQAVFSTYIGGSLDDSAMAIALDAAQNVYVGGFTISKDFPVTAGALQTTFKGIDPANQFFYVGDGFVAKLASSGASLAWATYLGGSGDDSVMALFAAGDGTVWAAGSTSSTDFPVSANALQHAYAGYTMLPLYIEQNVGDAMVAHINASGSGLLYATYLGGAGNDLASTIAVDPAGLVYVAGFTESMDFPVTANATQSHMAGSGGSNLYFDFGDGFVSVIDPTASRLVFSTFSGATRMTKSTVWRWMAPVASGSPGAPCLLTCPSPPRPRNPPTLARETQR